MVVGVAEGGWCCESHCLVLFVGLVLPRDRVKTSDGSADSRGIVLHLVVRLFPLSGLFWRCRATVVQQYDSIWQVSRRNLARSIPVDQGVVFSWHFLAS